MKDFIKIPDKKKDLLKKKPEIRIMIERNTNTKISLNEDVEIDGESLDIFIAKNVLKAFGRGFTIEDSLKLLDDEYGLEIISLTDFVSSKNRLETVKARIIGTRGKTKKYIESYTNSKVSIYGKTVSLIGKWDDLATAKEAVMMLIHGSPHATVYRWLEQRAKVF